MGKGDPRTAKGKRFKGSFGISRLQKAVKKAAPTATVAAAAAKPAKKKAAKKKSEE